MSISNMFLMEEIVWEIKRFYMYGLQYLKTNQLENKEIKQNVLWLPLVYACVRYQTLIAINTSLCTTKCWVLYNQSDFKV